MVWAPAIEALLWFYRAEMEGKSINTDELASLMSSAPSIMIRWVAVLLDRNLVMNEHAGPILDQTSIRITEQGERKVDKLLSMMTD